MSERTTNLSTSDERLMGALAHFFGVLVALIIWGTQKDKSRFLRFQSLQAIAFSFAVMIISGLLFSGLFGVMFIGMLVTMFSATSSTSPDSGGFIFMLPAIFPFAIFICIFPYSIFLMLIRFIAAGSVLSGRDFRYPILGKLVENFLGDES